MSKLYDLRAFYERYLKESPGMERVLYGDFKLSGGVDLSHTPDGTVRATFNCVEGRMKMRGVHPRFICLDDMEWSENDVEQQEESNDAAN